MRRYAGHRLPVRVSAIAAKLGLPMFPERLPQGVDGALFCYPEGPIILYDPASPKERVRFTLAHEIGHWVLGHASPVSCHAPGIRDDGEERLANHFAAALLMPRRAVLRAWLDGEAFTAMAARFEVSLEAMHWRLVELGLV